MNSSSDRRRGLGGGRGTLSTLEVKFAGDEARGRSWEGERGASNEISSSNSMLDVMERAGDTGLRPVAGDNVGEYEGDGQGEYERDEERGGLFSAKKAGKEGGVHIVFLAKQGLLRTRERGEVTVNEHAGV